MDILPALITAAPQFGLVGYLIYLLKHVMGHASTDRGDYRQDLDAAERRHAEEIARLRTSYEADLALLRAELTDLRGRVVELTGQLDDERRRRWRAEDIAAQARRENHPTGLPDTADPLGG